MLIDVLPPLALVAILVLVPLLVANRMLDRRLAAEVAVLVREADAPRPIIALADHADLPGPVLRYLLAAGVDGRRRVRLATLEHAGRFRARPEGGWQSVLGREWFTTDPPSFVWSATVNVRMLPVRARDLYHRGRGHMLVRALGLVPLGDAEGPDVAAAALLRWLAETPWFPTALVPGEGVRWQAVDDGAARAVVRDAALEVTGLFRFGEDGLPSAFEAERFRTVEGEQVRTPWIGRYGDYRAQAGLVVPMRATVAWRVDGEDREYADFEVSRIDYDRRRA